jgi:hypothetical protein
VLCRSVRDLLSHRIRHEAWYSLQAELYPDFRNSGFSPYILCHAGRPKLPYLGLHRLPLGITLSSGWMGWSPGVPTRCSPMPPCALSDRLGERISRHRPAAWLLRGSTDVNRLALPVTTSGRPAACMGGLSFVLPKQDAGERRIVSPDFPPVAREFPLGATPCCRLCARHPKTSSTRIHF